MTQFWATEYLSKTAGALGALGGGVLGAGVGALAGGFTGDSAAALLTDESMNRHMADHPDASAEDQADTRKLYDALYTLPGIAIGGAAGMGVGAGMGAGLGASLGRPRVQESR